MENGGREGEWKGEKGREVKRYIQYSRCKNRLQNRSTLSPTIYMTIYKSTNLQAVNIKTLMSSNRSNKLMFAYLDDRKEVLRTFCKILSTSTVHDYSLLNNIFHC